MAAPMRLASVALSQYSQSLLQFTRFHGSHIVRRVQIIKLISTRTYHRSPSVACALSSCCAAQAGKLQGDAIDIFQSFDWISSKAPCFSVCGDQITVLKGPVEYFGTLKEQIGKSKHRIVLAALYLGTGPQEDELVRLLYDACRRSHTTNPSAPLKVQVLLDCTRGSRGEHNSRTMLLPLLQDFPSEVRVSLYHTPDLRGVLKKVVPERYNEVVGLSHLKVCIFDDTLIISGANLSESYFTNRQDRYVMLEDCPRVADFFSELVSTVSSFSFQLNPDDTLTLDPEVNIHPYEGNERKFKEIARDKIQGVLDPLRWSNSSGHMTKPRHSYHGYDLRCTHRKTKWRKHGKLTDEISTRESLRGMHKDVTCNGKNKLTSHEQKLSETDSPKGLKPDCAVNEIETKAKNNILSEKSGIQSSEIENQHRTNFASSSPSDSKELTRDRVADTLVFPLVQMGSFGVRVDQEVTGQLLRSLEADSRCILASGYFNLTRDYMKLVLRSKAAYKILMASPQANGFYGAKGFSGNVPTAYTFIARSFFRKVCRRNQEQRISMYEYYRDGWTFHVKGLWHYLHGESLPSLTLIGSPNFGHRSVHRDLEAQIAIITTNDNLRNQLHQEQQQFFQQSEPVTMATFEKPDRRVPLWARIFTLVMRNYF